MAVQFQKAVRTAVKIKLGVQGPSGSGKTMGALALATALAGNKRVAVLDTENGSAALYSDRFDFDTVTLSPPYSSKRFQEVINAAVQADYGALVIDSITHQWDGEGGILARKEEVDTRGGNTWTNWRAFTKEHNEFLAALLNAPIHMVCTMRSKQDYLVETNDKGKSAPKKVGMKAIQREGAEYEFTVNFELQMDHRAIASKDRTDLFDSPKGLFDLTDFATAKMLLDWLGTAKAEAVLSNSEMTLSQALAFSFPFRGDNAGKPLGEMHIDAIEEAIAKLTGVPKDRVTEKHNSALKALQLVREDRIKAIVTGHPSELELEGVS